MSKYELNSRAKVKDHIPWHESASITLQAGVCVLFRATLMVIFLYLSNKYGGNVLEG